MARMLGAITIYAPLTLIFYSILILKNQDVKNRGGEPKYNGKMYN